MQILKFVLYTGFLVLLNFALNQSCAGNENVDYQKDTVVEITSSGKICVNDKDVSIESIKTLNGITTEANLLETLKCLPAVQDKLCMQFSKRVFHVVIIKSTDDKMLILNSDYTSGFKDVQYTYRNTYFTNELECFKTTDVDEANIKTLATTISGKLYTDKLKTTYCVIFTSEETKIAVLQIKNKNELQITSKQRANVGNHFLRSIPECQTFTNDINILQYSVIDRLAQYTSYFCVKSSEYVFESLIRIKNSMGSMNDYCWKEIVNSDAFCMTIGVDLYYAIFYGLKTNRKMIIMAKQAYVDARYTNAIPQQNKAISIGDITCSNINQYKSRNQNMFIGYYNDDKDTHCILGKEIIGKDRLEFIVSKNEFTNEITGCDIDASKTLSNVRTINLGAEETKFCLPNGFTNFELIYEVNGKIEKFHEHETKVCFIKLPSKVCYYMIKNVKKLLISNEYDSSKILVHRNLALINENIDEKFLFQENYYKNEIICHQKEKVELPSEIPKHFHDDGNKICVVVAAMEASGTITIKNIAGCEKRKIQLSPSTSRKPNPGVVDLAECKPFYDSSEDAQTKFYVISNYEKLKKCLVATCSTAKYSFSIDWSTNPIDTSKVSNCETNIELCKPGGEDLYIVYKVRNDMTNRDIFFKSNAQIGDFSANEKKIIYASTYYRDEVVCFVKENVEGDTSESIFKIQADGSAIICSIVRELDSDKKFTLKTHGNCKRSINLLPTMNNPNSNAVRVEKQCEAVFNHQTEIYHQTTLEVRSLCISLTCTTLTYIIDLSQENYGDSYRITECITVNGVNPCTALLEKESIVKVSTDRAEQNYRILYSKPVKDWVHENAVYLPYYDSKNLVCFKVSKIKNKNDLKPVASYLESEDNLCVLNKELTAKITINYKIYGEKTMNIVLDNAFDETEKGKAIEMRTKCLVFWTVGLPTNQIRTTGVNDLKICIKTLFIEVNVIVKEDNSIETCSDTIPCNVDDNTIKYIKVTSRYNGIVLYLIEEKYQEKILSSENRNFFKSSYKVDEIVCLRKSAVRDEKALNNAGVASHGDDKLCYVVNDLTENRKISIDVSEGKLKEIYLVKTEQADFPPAALVEGDNNCASFIVVPTSNTLIKMTLSTLKSCIAHIGLKTIFIVKLPIGSNPFVTSATYCDSIEGDCFTGINNFEYVKLTNLYPTRDFYVQNSDERTISSAASFFHQSPSYKGEVLCISNSDLRDINQYTISNSYTLGGYKCIIIGELQTQDTITFSDAGRCSRQIKIDSTTMISPTAVRDVNGDVCREFMNLNVGGDIVHSVTIKALKNCVIHTCNKIATCVEMPGTNIPLIHSNVITTTASDDSKCTDENKIYDFVRVQKGVASVPFKYFRTFENAKLPMFVPTRTVFYDSKYYKDEIVCFNEQSLTVNNALKASQTFFQEDERICFLLNLITTQETVTNKVKEGCELRIILSVNPRPAQIVEAENTREYCSDFFSSRNPEGRYPVYTKAKILNCVQKSCSKVEHFIELTSVNEDYPTKILSTCTTSPATTLENCLGTKNNLEGIKVKSPFLNSFLYLHTSDEKSALLQFYKSRYYKDAYYKDEVLCIHENLLLSKDILLSTDGIFKKKQVICFVPNELKNPLTIRIMIYGECQKSVLLVHNQTRLEFEGASYVDVCADFYALQTSPYKQIPIGVLGKCLVSTCSKLDYFVTDSIVGEKNVKNMHKCLNKFGDASCLSDTTIYELAKITNPSVGANGLIIKSDTLRDITDDELKKSYYKSKYYMNEIVCIHNDMLKTSISGNELLPLENSNQKCIIIDVLAGGDEKDIIVELANDCTKTVKLYKKVKRTDDYDKDDRDCLQFLTENGHKDNTVGLMTVEILKKCIQQTCSKVISYVELANTNELINSKTLTKKTAPAYGDYSALADTKHYDLVKIVSPYRTAPLMFQTYDSDEIVYPTQNPSQSLTFGPSKYENDRFMCYRSAILANPQEIENLNGVYSTTNRKCVIPSDLAKALTIHVIVRDTCSRKIILSPTPNAQETTAIGQIDTACIKYTTDTQGENLIIGDMSSVMKCVAHTCSIAKYFGTLQSNDDCSKESDASKCSDNKKYDYAIVSSLYKISPFLTMSNEMKSTYTSNDLTIAKYKIFYSPDEISCFKNDVLSTVSEGMSKFTESNSNTGLYCYQFTKKDKQYVISYNPTDNQNKFKYLSGSNTKSSSIKFSIFGRNGSNDVIEQVYTYKHQFGEENSVFTEIDEFEDCASAKLDDDQQNILVSNTPIVEEGYAFAVSANYLLQNDVMFYMNKQFACAAFFKNENEHFWTQKSIYNSDTLDLAKSDCVFVENDYPTITLNSLSSKKDIVAIEGANCVKFEQLNATCQFLFHYSDHITICLKKKSETKMSSSKLSHPIFILLKKNECFYHKATAWKRILLCQYKDAVLSVDIFDWSMFETQKTSLLTRHLKTTSFATAGIISVIVLIAVVFIMKHSSSNRDSSFQRRSSV